MIEPLKQDLDEEGWVVCAAVEIKNLLDETLQTDHCLPGSYSTHDVRVRMRFHLFIFRRFK